MDVVEEEDVDEEEEDANEVIKQVAASGRA
jgi:hypothetical protein